MKFSSLILLASIAASSVTADGPEEVAGTTTFEGDGFCKSSQSTRYLNHFYTPNPNSVAACDEYCRGASSEGLLGFNFFRQECYCWTGKGPIDIVDGTPGTKCYVYTHGNAEGNGDPHFRTWKDEHFEFHGQCDVVFSKAKDFAGPGKDLDIHLRTSMVRYWSYIKTVAIRIDNEILEVEGSAAKEDGVDKRHYRINYEYRGSLEDGIGGFPISINPRNNMYTIDLDSKYPGQKIQIKTFKEFVGVKIIGANQESFGNSVGIIGDYKTGKTLARDGHTVLNDFNELGLEWQVLPSDGKLFHEMARPQFPELCYLPENPRGERTRRLAESDITEEAAEAACAGLKDEFDRKGCIYDILATQDMDMVGAY